MSSSPSTNRRFEIRSVWSTKNDNWLFYSQLFFCSSGNSWYNCPNPVTVDVGIISVLGWENSRDIHLAGKPVPEGIVGHLGYPNGKELCPSAPPTCPTAMYNSGVGVQMNVTRLSSGRHPDDADKHFVTLKPHIMDSPAAKD